MFVRVARADYVHYITVEKICQEFIDKKLKRVYNFSVVEFDNIHYSYRKIDGYNKPFRFVMGPREPGKTATMWYRKIWCGWKKDFRPWVYFVRHCPDITESAIETIVGTIQKFTNDKISVTYKKGDFEKGIADVYVDGKIFFRFVALSIPLRRIKLAVLHNVKAVFMDEYIIDTTTGESYVKGEAFKIKEAFTTWVREASDLVFYFAANPYSLFNPLFLAWGVNPSGLKKGHFYVGDEYVIEWITISAKLRDYILKRNPLYQFDEEYAAYALESTPKNDKNIRLGTLPANYFLRHIFVISGQNVGVFQSRDYTNDVLYHVAIVDDFSKKRVAFCINFDELQEKTVVLTDVDRLRLRHLKRAIGDRMVTYADINVYYLMKEVYNAL